MLVVLIQMKMTRRMIDVTLRDPDMYISEMMNECYLISKGVRSAYMTSLVLTEYDEADIEANEQFIQELKDTANSNGLIFSIAEYPREKDDMPDRRYYRIWVLKYPHQLKIVDNLYKLDRCMRKYVMGKLLGYSDESMEEFMSKNYPDQA